MIDNITFVLAVTMSCVLIYGLKSRFYRKWLGIGLGIIGVILVFTIRPEPDEFYPFTIQMVMWFTGLTLFCERGKYEDQE